jgi:hypothetical protein
MHIQILPYVILCVFLYAKSKKGLHHYLFLLVEMGLGAIFFNKTKDL